MKKSLEGMEFKPELAETYYVALKTIYQNEGKVCNEYEICTCASCASSYNSWAVAYAALQGDADFVIGYRE